MRKTCGLFVALACTAASGQTTIDLNTQSRNVDFSTAASTRPFKTGVSIPATCNTGDVFFHSAGTPAQVIYACTSTNTWTAQGGGLTVSGAGLVTQTAGGAVTRSITAGNGLVISNADGQTGNPAITADIATQTEAENGMLATKMMTPERTRQAFQAWNPMPNQSNKAFSLLSTDGSNAFWSWKLIVPKSGVQPLSSSSATITVDRLFVNVEPATAVSLASVPVMVDGEDGQFVTITNVSTTNAVTLPDESVLSGSNLRLGGVNLTLGPRQSATFVFSSALSEWVLTHKPGASGVVIGPASAADSQLALFDGTTGKLIKPYSETGIVRVVNGTPSVVSGAASAYVRVDGTTGSPANRTVFTWSGGNTIPSGATSYVPVSGSSSPSTSENLRISVMPFAGTLSRFYVRTSSGQTSSGSMTCSIRVNEASPENTPSITISAGGAASTYSDLANSATVAAGDTVAVRCTNSGTSASANLVAISIGFTF